MCVCKFKNQISIVSYPLYKKRDIRNHVCSSLQKKYVKDELENKEWLPTGDKWTRDRRKGGIKDERKQYFS